MDRKQYLLEQKQRGKAIFGVFPSLYPKEILWSMNIVPAEIWDPPMEPTKANAHLQSYICSVVKLGLELIVQGKCDFLDGFLFPHTCDSIQNMASVILDYIGTKIPCYFFYHPKEPYSKATEKYFITQIEALINSLESRFGPMENESLSRSILLSQEINHLLEELYDKRATGLLDISNKDFYSLVRKGEYLLPGDFARVLKDHLNQEKPGTKKIRQKTPVILSGILPNPLELLTVLDELGVTIVHDDLLNCSRRFFAPKSASADPFQWLKDRYFSLPPCSTRGSAIPHRLEFLLNLIKMTEAKGVIFNVVKFCEPEWFDLPNLTEELKKHSIPTLVLDTEINQGLSGQVITRIEAFVEMLE